MKSLQADAIDSVLQDGIESIVNQQNILIPANKLALYLPLQITELFPFTELG